ncbi:MAG: NAD(P)H-dependent oxidoreductase [Aureispira sp.]|nr:NAD(P)H-dependent oxidoreductase [Aureispira sp.]
MALSLGHLQWRYATKKFDSSKKISPSNLQTLLQSAQLAASSYGLQPYKILHIKNTELRERLRPASWNQAQIVEASDLLVFCAYNQFDTQTIDDHLALVSQVRHQDMANLEGYGNFMKTKLLGLSQDTLQNWMAKQAYIALGFLLTTAAQMGIDACPMEGFEASEYTKILNLKGQGLQPTVAVTLGYRSAEDGLAKAPKVRKPLSELVIPL